MNFNKVLKALRTANTKKFHRNSWSGGKYIVLMTERCIEECLMTPDTGAILGVPPTRGYKIRPFFLIKTKYDYEFTIYNPSYEDLSGYDWEEKAV